MGDVEHRRSVHQFASDVVLWSDGNARRRADRYW